MIEKNGYYRYALDNNDNVVHISTVNEDNRRAGYRCVSCHCELTPVLGEKKAHHFRHKTDTCKYESYLHKLAKYLLKQKFDTCEKFELFVQQKKICEKLNTCPFGLESECHILENKTFDLKQKGYDLCQEEKSVLNGEFVADLLITSEKNNKKPLLIEICVTHKSTDEKRNSGLPIIELKINNESQIKDLIENPIGYKEAKYGHEYINFKNSHCCPIDIRIPLSKLIVYESGKSFFLNYHIFQEERYDFDCSKLNENKKGNTQIEIALMPFFSDYNIPLFYCYQKKIKACYCSLCFFSTDSFNGLVCKLYKTKGTPHYPEVEQYIDCKYFRINHFIEDKLSENLNKTPMLELPSNI